MTENAEEPAAAPSRRQRWRARWTWLVLVVSVAAFVTAFISWRQADNDPDRARAALRDQAIIEGTDAVETMNSMDYRHVRAGLKEWRSVTTGVLHDQVSSIGADQRQLLASQGKIAKGRVVQAALTELTDRTATMIAAIEVTVADKDKPKKPSVKRNRYTADLDLVDGVWKIESLTQVPVSLS